MSRYITGSFRWRILRPVFAILILVSLTASYIYIKNRPSYALYDSIAESELARSRSWIAEAEPRRYVKFRQLQGAGFNNQAQEILLFHHLALTTSRTYVFQPFVWRPRGEESLVPLSAFLRGATEDAVSSVVFDEVCPPATVKHIQISVPYTDMWAHSKKVLEGPEKCVVVDNWIFNWQFLASEGLHRIWPSFRSYLAKYFQWSDQIKTIAGRAHSHLNLRSKPTAVDGEPYMALHFRRGDFENHCQGLAEDRVGFTTWATLPSLAMSIFPPALDTSNETSVMEHCYPTLDRIVDAISVHARARPHLRTLHVLHDGAWDHPLVYLEHYKLERALKEVKGWPQGPMIRITHSGQVPIGWAEADLAVTVDVELARNAEVFIGNGYSSLSTQIIALRLGADSGHTEAITLY